MKSSDSLGISKIGYLDPSFWPGTLVWSPWMSRKIRNLILILTRHYFLLSFLQIPVILSFTTFRDSKFYILYVIRFLKTLPIDFPTNNQLAWPQLETQLAKTHLIKKLLLQNVSNFYQRVQNGFWKQEMELSKQEMELFLLYPDLR